MWNLKNSFPLGLEDGERFFQHREGRTLQGRPAVCPYKLLPLGNGVAHNNLLLTTHGVKHTANRSIVTKGHSVGDCREEKGVVNTVL